MEESKVTKETSSFGKRGNKTHTLCLRCGSKAYHPQKSTCGKCGYPAKCKRNFFSPWSMLSLDKTNRETEAGESCVMPPSMDTDYLELRADGNQEAAREFKSLPLAPPANRPIAEPTARLETTKNPFRNVTVKHLLGEGFGNFIPKIPA
ncbi:hypothetical protein U0070_018516 [Myodes glareolus]|uniref:60S ribosomal protein L37 n=1 Tax=Myodes glareolus TaxID=447135 RepID=A0AAW0JVB5_MYOGA